MTAHLELITPQELYFVDSPSSMPTKSPSPLMSGVAKPRLAIRVSFVGKRKLDANLEWNLITSDTSYERVKLLEGRVSEVLELIEKLTKSLIETSAYQELYSTEGPRLIGISSLATGGDM